MGSDALTDGEEVGVAVLRPENGLQLKLGPDLKAEVTPTLTLALDGKMEGVAVPGP